MASVLLLTLAFGLMVHSAVRKSATVDEQTHWQRGTAYLQEDATQFLIGNPVVGHAFASLFLLTEPNLIQPITHPSWEDGNWSVAGHLFMWELNEDPIRMTFLGRVVTLWLTLLLGAVVCRWGRDWGGWPVGLLALLLTIFDPNILAHGRLATNDLAVSLTIFATIWLFWRYQKSERRRYLLLTGLAVGLSAAMKLNGALVVPILGLLAVGTSYRKRAVRPLVELVGVGLLSWLVIWVLFGFELRPLPGGAYWDDLFWQLDYLGGQQGVYLNGAVATGGWWYYFPVAFLVKMPLLTLGLLSIAVVISLWQRNRSAPLGHYLWLPPALYLGLTLFNALNIGFRYLLPIVPFVTLFCVVTLWRHLSARPRLQTGLAVLVGLFPVVAIWLWPNYLPYFNAFAGGPAGGWRLLSDSNVDWGQDLPQLAAWQAKTGHSLNLSYFGTAAPSAYGLAFEAMPTWSPTPEQSPPNRQLYVPANPEPGYYAISVTHLHGAVLGNQPDTYAYFREVEPIERIGGSIFIYEVAEAGEAVVLALGNVLPAELPARLVSPAGSNNRHIRWFEPMQALLLPKNGTAVVGSGLSKLLLPFLDILAANEPLEIAEMATFTGSATQYGNQLALTGYLPLASESGQRNILTHWQVLAPSEQRLKIFFHEVNAAGDIVAQWDGLGADSLSWQAGDQLLQLITLPPATIDNPGWRIGVYDADTAERLPAADGDFLTLSDVNALNWSPVAP